MLVAVARARCVPGSNATASISNGSSARTLAGGGVSAGPSSSGGTAGSSSAGQTMSGWDARQCCARTGMIEDEDEEEWSAHQGGKRSWGASGTVMSRAASVRALTGPARPHD
eukprot:4558833-Prymnesium_polylepis.1